MQEGAIASQGEEAQELDAAKTPQPQTPGLVCPHCRGPLGRSDAGYDCAACQATYPIHEGVPSFIEADEFYETRYEPGAINLLPNEGRFWNRWLLYFVSLHYLWFVRKYFNRPGAVLDVACGGGTRYLTTRGPVVGLDVSLNSLKFLHRKGWYHESVRASAFEVPYPDESFDFICAKFFFEHVSPETKPGLLREFSRLLKPGGRLIMLFDCDCSNRLWQWAKRDPDLFQSAFIENDGHYGLMRPSETLELLKAEGYKVLGYHAANKTSLVHLPMLGWLGAYKSKSRVLRLVLPLTDAIARNRLLSTAYTFSVTAWDDIMEPLLPLDRARFLLVACERKS
ncbi:Methyltransferase domain-containing protein [Singulisphaera sp. GP187]|uniref:methyltransferase domain-containing protein n=1 Tax=Singulisphaera sp. GP187 TaxID=1882752 RepID=UPI00092B9571|nr:methyltransferase domain-containing protein [Singulisphaera sp. GP187]SIO55321.1 Methyltransferase domain-containing protein [Singulisphaera sp. GP187]